MKPILCIDFDGVLHSYTSPWKNAAIVPDSPVPGAIDFLMVAQQHFRIAIFSSRSHQPGGIQAMQTWLSRHVAAEISDVETVDEILAAIEWPTEKPAAFLTIDDRALTFTGVWPDIDHLRKFKPWNK